MSVMTEPMLQQVDATSIYFEQFLAKQLWSFCFEVLWAGGVPYLRIKTLSRRCVGGGASEAERFNAEFRTMKAPTVTVLDLFSSKACKRLKGIARKTCKSRVKSTHQDVHCSWEGISAEKDTPLLQLPTGLWVYDGPFLGSTLPSPSCLPHTFQLEIGHLVVGKGQAIPRSFGKMRCGGKPMENWQGMSHVLGAENVYGRMAHYRYIQKTHTIDNWCSKIRLLPLLIAQDCLEPTLMECSMKHHCRANISCMSEAISEIKWPTKSDCTKNLRQIRVRSNSSHQVRRGSVELLGGCKLILEHIWTSWTHLTRQIAASFFGTYAWRAVV